MSKYTTEVRYICEHYSGLSESVDLADVEQVIKNSIPGIFDFDFPIFDESYRNVLETKILRHYYTREIGLETVGLWKLKLNTKLNEIMPYYNQLYKSELLTFNPLYDVDLTREHTKKNEDVALETNKSNDKTVTNRNDNGSGSENYNRDLTDTNTESATRNANHVDKYSDTPQGSLQNVESGTYLTNARIIDDTDTGSSNSTLNRQIDDSRNYKTQLQTNDSKTYNQDHTKNLTENNLENYIEKVSGKQGSSSSELLMQFRETFLNIDMLIIDELSELFMGIW